MLNKYQQSIKDKLLEIHTNGEEFTSGIILPDVKIGHIKCDYCGKELIAVFDEYNKNDYCCYLGCQAVSRYHYKYSKILNFIKKYYGINEEENWTDNPLVNIHTRIHSNPTRWDLRASDKSLRFLCNDCFKLTYNRIKVKSVYLNKEIIHSLSVVDSRNETIESVMQDLEISGEILGKGRIEDYD